MNFKFIYLFSSISIWSSNGIDNSSFCEVKPRQRRHLVFPDKSNLMIVVLLLKTTKFGMGLSTMHELEVLVPIPRNVYLLEAGVNYRQRRDRTILFSQLESVLDVFGLDGRSCIVQLICHFKSYKPRNKDISIFIELLQTIFRMPAGSDPSVYDVPLSTYCKQSSCGSLLVKHFLRFEAYLLNSYSKQLSSL